MTQMPDQQPTQPDLPRVAAFADGELTGEEHLHLLEQSQQDPQVAAKIRHQQQLRRVCQRVMADKCACPCAIKDRIQSLCDDLDCASAPTVLARIGRWAPALVAAVLLIGAVAMYRDAFSRPADGTSPVVAAGALDAIVPISQAERFSTRHDTCSRSVETLRNVAKYPHSLAAIPDAVATRLGSPVPALDLTSLGYEFKGAGDCLIPGSTSVHLVYQARPDSGHSDSVSLWMCPDDGKLAIDPSKVYQRQCPKSQRKLLVWRQAGVVYYLIGDEPDRMETIAQSLRT